MTMTMDALVHYFVHVEIIPIVNCTFMGSIGLMGGSFVVSIEKNANKIIMEIIDCSSVV